MRKQNWRESAHLKGLIMATNAERQRAYRARKAAEKMAEVRGIFATFDDAKKIKAFADSIKSENGAK